MPITQYAIDHAKELGVTPKRLEHLEKMLHRWVDDGINPAITARVMRSGHCVFEGSYGTTETSPLPQSLKIDAIFPLASITKPVIAVLLMQLQEDGFIDLQDRVSTYIPGFENKDDIQIWHLLTHTSGIFDNYLQSAVNDHLKNEYGVELEENCPHEEFVEKMLKVRLMMGLPLMDDRSRAAYDTRKIIELKMPATLKPRECMGYCNAGYQYCRDIITNVCGESIDAVAKKKIFDPLGMFDSHWILPKEKWNRVVLRPEGCDGYPWQNSEGCFISESGAGGLKSTVYDITRFAEAIRCGGLLDGERILSPISVRAMTSDLNHDMPNSYDSWAIGWNYRGAKYDDAGMVRPSTALDHGGFGGTKLLIDKENKLSWAFFSISKGSAKVWLFPLFTNIVYSALY